MDINEINSMSKEQFINTIGVVFEHSPWVSEHAWEKKHPFPNSQQLFRALIQAMYDADKKNQLGLLCAHPDLGSRLKMTKSSVQEQKGAGLDRLSELEYKELKSLNEKYTNCFNFPFIFAVKGKSKEEIFTNMKGRLGNSQDIEFQTALTEVGKIAMFRLSDVIKDLHVKEGSIHD